MVPRAAMDAAHAAAVMVRAHGPDPKGRKMRRHAFFHTESGDTTLSASGFLSLRTAALEMDEKPLPMHRNQFDTANVSGSSVVVVTCASIVEPFLSQQPYGTSPVEARHFPKLITGAEIDVLLEVPGGKPTADEYQSQCWIPARLERVVDIPAAGAALQSLLDVHGGSVDGPWEVGWALAPLEGNSQLQGLGTRALGARVIVEDEPSRRWASVEEPGYISSATNGIRVGSLSMTATRVAILSLSGKGSEAASTFQDCVFQGASGRHMSSKVSFDLAVASSLKRGDFLLAVGSPFGALSPLHFHNSLSAGVVSNCWPPKSEPVALVMADVRCLPGMEGGPVFDEQGALVGMLMRPLRQRGGGAEVQLVMTSAVLAPALLHDGVTLGVPSLLQNLLFDRHVATPTQLNGAATSLEADSCRGIIISNPSPNSESKHFIPLGISHALNSVVLVTIGDGAWASGVIISRSGLILTNAHLLEPWRFGKMRSSHHHTLLSSKCEGESSMVAEGKTNYDVHYAVFDQLGSQRTAGDENSLWDGHDQDLVSSQMPSPAVHLDGRRAQADVTMKSTDIKWRGYQRIRVRLDHLQARTWHNAEAVYVSQGPLDIALLQLVAPPMGLCPIIPEESCPSPGSTAVVIGHGLFGPRAELSPSVSAGVVARVVKAGSQALSRDGVTDGDTYPLCPAMLQTTAAVHPGGSGGAVVNSRGHMIGLVTSNARHSGGSVIPFLNFSVPIAALSPILDFASKDGADFAVLSELDKPDKFLSAVWALVPSTPPRPPLQPMPTPIPPLMSPLPQTSPNTPLDPQKGTMKGSRFAKFFTEKSAELALHQPLKPENSRLLPQKLVDVHATSNSSSNRQFCSRL